MIGLKKKQEEDKRGKLGFYRCDFQAKSSLSCPEKEKQEEEAPTERTEDTARKSFPAYRLWDLSLSGAPAGRGRGRGVSIFGVKGAKKGKHIRTWKARRKSLIGAICVCFQGRR